MCMFFSHPSLNDIRYNNLFVEGNRILCILLRDLLLDFMSSFERKLSSFCKEIILIYVFKKCLCAILGNAEFHSSSISKKKKKKDTSPLMLVPDKSPDILSL